MDQNSTPACILLGNDQENFELHRFTMIEISQNILGLPFQLTL